jgi:hypothetical protein
MTYPKQLPNNWKYRLLEDIYVLTGITPLMPSYSSEFMSINRLGVLHMKAGYSWDGASGHCPDHEAIMYPSCVHDGLCQLFTLGIITKAQRYAADALLGTMVRAEMYRLSERWGSIKKAAHRTWAEAWSRMVWFCVRSYSVIT